MTVRDFFPVFQSFMSTPCLSVVIGVHCMVQMDTFHSADCPPEERFSVIHYVLLAVSNMEFRFYGFVCAIWLCNCNAEAMNEELASHMKFQMNDYSWYYHKTFKTYLCFPGTCL